MRLDLVQTTGYHFLTVTLGTKQSPLGYGRCAVATDQRACVIISMTMKNISKTEKTVWTHYCEVNPRLYYVSSAMSSCQGVMLENVVITNLFAHSCQLFLVTLDKRKTNKQKQTTRFYEKCILPVVTETAVE